MSKNIQLSHSHNNNLMIDQFILFEYLIDEMDLNTLKVNIRDTNL